MEICSNTPRPASNRNAFPSISTKVEVCTSTGFWMPKCPPRGPPPTPSSVTLMVPSSTSDEACAYASSGDMAAIPVSSALPSREKDVREPYGTESRIHSRCPKLIGLGYYSAQLQTAAFSLKAAAKLRELNSVCTSAFGHKRTLSRSRRVLFFYPSQPPAILPLRAREISGPNSS